MKKTTDLDAPSGVGVDALVSCTDLRVASAMLRHRIEDEIAMRLNPALTRAQLGRDRLSRLADQFGT